MKNKTLTIMMFVLAGMTALPMQAMPVLQNQQKSEIQPKMVLPSWETGHVGHLEARQ